MTQTQDADHLNEQTSELHMHQLDSSEPRWVDMPDHIVKATGMDGRVRALACLSTQTVEQFRVIHDLSPLSTIAMGRFAMGAQLMAGVLKNPTDVMSMTLKCNGSLKGMVVVSDYLSQVRGYCLNEHVDGAGRVKDVVGQGTLTVVKDMGLKTPYSGTVDLISGEISEDLSYYLVTSEQVPSVMATSVLLSREGVHRAGGFLIQLMPGYTEADIEYIEQRVSGFPDIGFLMSEGFSPAQWIDLFLGDPGLKYLDEHPIGFQCTCSKNRMIKNLLALGRSELESLAVEDDGIDLHCHFCNQDYHFNQAELSDLL